MIKIDTKVKERIKSILLSRIDSQQLSESSHQSIFRKVLPLLPQRVSLDEFKSAISRFVEQRWENPKKAFNLFIESLEMLSIRIPHDNIGKQIQATKKTKSRSQEKKVSMERSPTRQGLKKSPIDKGRQGLKQIQWRLDDSDRLMATARHPDYIEDWQAFTSELRKGTTNHQTIKTFLEKLCQKWELKSPIPPYLGKEGKDQETIFKANQLEAILELTEDEWPNRNSLYAILSKAIGKCEFVRLRIDLTRSEKELKKYFGQMIKAWKRDIPKERKARKTKFDPWEIYDMHKVDGHKFPKIAKILYERDRKSNEHLFAYKQYFERVNAAYSRAKDMINQVSKEAKMR